MIHCSNMRVPGQILHRITLPLKMEERLQQNGFNPHFTQDWHPQSNMAMSSPTAMKPAKEAANDELCDEPYFYAMCLMEHFSGGGRLAKLTSHGALGPAVKPVPPAHVLLAPEASASRQRRK